MSGRAVSRVSMTLPQAMYNQCWLDGRRVKLSPCECRMLSLLLVTPPNHLISDDVLIEAVWPDPDRQPLNTTRILGILKYRLRKKGLAVRSGGNRRTWSVPEDERDGRPQRRHVPAFVDELPWYHRYAA